MRINSAYKLHKLGRFYMIVDNCTDNQNLARVYTLNQTAGLLWKAVESRDFSVADLVDILCDTYDVDSEKAETDARNWVVQLEKYEFVTR